jgi:hypothetical protein
MEEGAKGRDWTCSEREVKDERFLVKEPPLVFPSSVCIFWLGRGI